MTTPTVLEGKTLAKSTEAEIAARVEALKARFQAAFKLSGRFGTHLSRSRFREHPRLIGPGSAMTGHSRKGPNPRVERQIVIDRRPTD
jgi:hypothetical protein